MYRWEGMGKMKTFKPWQDVIPLLAGANSRQRRPLGEVFAPSATVENAKRGRLSLKVIITRLLGFAATRIGRCRVAAAVDVQLKVKE